MACPVCTFNLGLGVDHSRCLIKLFKDNRIQTVEEWRDLCAPKPKTTIIRRRKVVLPPTTET